MPSVLIEVRQQYSKEQESAIMEAVHSALREAFRILPEDRNVRLVVHEPHRFERPPSRARPELYTHISIDAFAGRSLDAKRKLYRTIVENVQSLGIPEDHVKILIREIPKENWGIRGAKRHVMLNSVLRSMFSRAELIGSRDGYQLDALR
jgi:phenylpyruvate tautomerase PptA (4-oxalocrotonate tautomerase family)